MSTIFIFGVLNWHFTLCNRLPL